MSLQAIDGGMTDIGFRPTQLGRELEARLGGSIGPAEAAPKYGAATLYQADGKPHENDIYQNSIGDCYLASAMGLLAKTNPDAIKQMIHYDAKTGTYSVQLYDKDGNRRTIPVTQDDIADNVARGGDSINDNLGGVAVGPSWPSVIESAYAKMNDSNWSDGLQQGYDIIGNGAAANAGIQALTGDSGDWVTYSKSWFESEGSALDRYAGQINAALANNRPVLAATQTEPSNWLQSLFGIQPEQDGLADGHAYMVDSISKDANGEWQVTLRNSWGENMNIGEGHDVAGPTVTVPLSRLVETQGLAGVVVGPAK